MESTPSVKSSNKSTSRVSATVVKANNIIEAKYKLSTREQKVLLFFISMLKPEHQSGNVYHTHVNEIMDVLNTAGTKWGDAYTSFKEIVTSLKSKPLHLESDRQLIICNWLGAVSIIKQSGEIQFAFEPQLEPFLFEVKKNFTKYPLQNVVRLKSSFSIRVYELLKQYAGIGKRRFALDDLRALLGIGEDLYPRYYDFKKRVLLIAQKELPKKTDISFTFVEERKGRKITTILFYIQCKDQANKGNPSVASLPHKDSTKEALSLEKRYELSEKEQRLATRLRELELNEWQIERVLLQVGAEGHTGIWTLINKVKMDRRDGKVRGSLGGYLARKLDQAYQLGFFKSED